MTLLAIILSEWSNGGSARNSKSLLSSSADRDKRLFINGFPTHNEAVEKPDSESFPAPDSCNFYRGLQLADSRDFYIQPSALAFWGFWRR
ncbi:MULTISPECIES: hypothetical protein, partial [unclassified Marinobacter]|uniref:hypothetical protein n=1 Tax=unclassified Marinobacter TaxID=83889 RepID=UPI001A7E6FF5